MKLVSQLIAGIAALVCATAAFAAVDVNKGSQAELESVKGIGPAVSTRILDARKNGAFKDWADLAARVKGVGTRNAARFSSDGLTVNGAPYVASTADAAKTGKSTRDAARSSDTARADKPAKPAKPSGREAAPKT